MTEIELAAGGESGYAWYPVARASDKPIAARQTAGRVRAAARKSSVGKSSVGDALDVEHRILATVDSIPKGRVASYGQIAEEAGLPRRARLVGRILGQLSEETELPWHRVVNAAGKCSVRDTGGQLEQRRRLEAEGVEFSSSGRIDLGRFRWVP